MRDSIQGEPSGLAWDKGRFGDLPGIPAVIQPRWGNGTWRIQLCAIIQGTFPFNAAIETGSRGCVGQCVMGELEQAAFVAHHKASSMCWSAPACSAWNVSLGSVLLPSRQELLWIWGE